MIRFPIPVLVALFVACSCRSGPEIRAAGPASMLASADYRYRNTVDFGEVDTEEMQAAFLTFAKLAERGEKAITLRIHSPGGSIFLGNAWARAVEDIKKRKGITVTCIVDSAAFSMAAVILESPVCDQRLATPRSAILFHNGMSGGRGGANEIRSALAMLEALNESMRLTVALRIGMKPDDLRQLLAQGDWVLSVESALRWHVIDGVVFSSEIAPPEEV